MPRPRPGAQTCTVESLRELAGWIYVVSSVALSAVTLVLCTPYLENAMFWPDFESNCTLSVLGALLNDQLSLLHDKSLPTPLNLLAPGTAIWQLPQVGINPSYPRLLLYQELTTLPVAIAGLRNLAPSAVSYMLTPYCWVDLQQRWVLAHTSARLRRCQRRDANNAAVYLETVLRNIDVAAWLVASGGSFTTKIAAAVATTPAGAAWVDAIEEHSLVSIADEIKHWESYNLTRFQLQYANR
ncbi:hypothetical protein ACHHYP_00728, partial [Achlya hypogyna]